MMSNIEEELKLEAMQRVWQRRMPSNTAALFEEPQQSEDPFGPLTQTPRPKGRCEPVPTYSDCIVPDNVIIDNEPIIHESVGEKSSPCQRLDASTLGDLPAVYAVYGLQNHQQPVVGIYVDHRIVPGFKYRVLPLPAIDNNNSPAVPLFKGKALTLKSIGRGYAKRFTFEGDKSQINNDNYFWSDNRPEGYAFELEVVADGDKFTVFDANHEAQGTLEILKIENPQVDISHEVTPVGVKKKTRVQFTGIVEFFETGVAKPMPMSGIVISLKKNELKSTQVLKITHVTYKKHRYYLTPGIQKAQRRVTVRGTDIGDIPTKYTMTGLESYEIPVVGTYVDPRIIPGFSYKVRPNDRTEHLFDGRVLRLLSIGMGYAKRLTFAPDSLVEPDNYLWSDNHPDGLGLEPRAVHTEMRFKIMADDQELGEAYVFRADLPQREERMERVMTASGRVAIVKYIHINVTCHVRLRQTGGGSEHKEQHLMRVYGLAIVRKEPNSNVAKVVRVENVGLDSQLNILFARTQTELTFHPL